MSIGKDLGSSDRVGTGGEIDRFCTKLFSQLDAVGIEIDSNNPATVGFELLNSQKPDEPQPKHRNRFAQCGLQQPDSLQRNRTQHRERGLFVSDSIRNSRAEILGDADDFGVVPI